MGGCCSSAVDGVEWGFAVVQLVLGLLLFGGREFSPDGFHKLQCRHAQ